MKDTDILFSIALMILGIVLMYKSMKGNSVISCNIIRHSLKR